MLLGFALLVLWKHRENIAPPDERNRATNRERVIDDLVDRLRLLRTPGIGPVTYRQLIARFGSPRRRLRPCPTSPRRGGGKAPALCSRDDAEREIAQVEKLGATLSGARAGPLSAAARRTRGCAAAADREGRPQAARPAGGRDRRRAQCLGGGVPLRARPGARSRAAGAGRRLRPRPRDRQRGA